MNITVTVELYTTGWYWRKMVDLGLPLDLSSRLSSILARPWCPAAVSNISATCSEAFEPSHSAASALQTSICVAHGGKDWRNLAFHGALWLAGCGRSRM